MWHQVLVIFNVTGPCTQAYSLLNVVLQVGNEVCLYLHVKCYIFVQFWNCCTGI